MFSSERSKMILELLSEYDSISVSKLSQLLHVSEVTIRKDLDRLSEKKLIERVHGGATLPGSHSSFAPSKENEDGGAAHKQLIGKVTAQMIQNNETVFIGSGSTCLAVAKELSDKQNVNIVTNNIEAAVCLTQFTGVRPILLGGSVTNTGSSHFTLYSPMSQLPAAFHFSKAIIPVDGISMETGYTLHNAENNQLFQSVISHSTEVIIVSDSSKFNTSAFLCLAPLDLNANIVTDEQAPEDYLKYYCEHNIRVFTTYNLDVSWKPEG